MDSSNLNALRVVAVSLATLGLALRFAGPAAGEKPEVGVVANDSNQIQEKDKNLCFKCESIIICK